MADFFLARQTERTPSFFVNWRVIPWPPEPLRLLASPGILGYRHAEEAAYDRGVGVPSGT